MYRLTVIVYGEGTGDLAAGLAEVLRKVEQGHTSFFDGEQDQQQQLDPYLEENLWEAAQELVEAGQLEIIRQEGEDAVWKLTPEGKLTAQLGELIGTERLERLHHLAESEGDEGGYDQLLQEIMNDLAPTFLWLAEHGF